jgi:hypothetical protein
MKNIQAIGIILGTAILFTWFMMWFAPKVLFLIALP